jgi:hypothetical protein
MHYPGFKFFLILSLFGAAFSSSKPVSIRDKATGQLVTSSLLTWEAFNAKIEAKQQFEFAITGGQFAEVSFYFNLRIIILKLEYFRRNLYICVALQLNPSLLLAL